jgi:diguanylate cyclase (GGDEF)-like protein
MTETDRMQPAPIPPDEPQRLAALHNLGLLFTPAEERFDRITRLASRALACPMALIALVGSECGWFKSVLGLDAAEAPRDVSFCAHAILNDDTLVVEDATLDPRFADNPLVAGDLHIRFYAGHPLHAPEGSRVGTLCVIDSKPRKLAPADLQTLRDLAALAETELQRGLLNEIQRELVRERDDLQRKAMIDSLTRVWNRGTILELLTRELARARRGSPVSVAMVDADHFKRINDTHGHLVGDAVLTEISARIRAAVREFDAVGRYGGEEFLVVLSECDASAAQHVTGRIAATVAATPVASAAGPLLATVSIGVATYSEHFATAEAMLAAADRALYRAKAAGRNRTEIAPEP